MDTIAWGDIITEILKWLLPIAIIWLVGVIGVLVRRVTPVLVAKFHSSLTADQQALALAVSKQGVQMAEQVWKRPDVQATFVSKKLLAEAFVNRNLHQYGIKMTAMDVEALIESAVYSEIHKTSTATPVSVQTGDVVVQGPVTETTQATASEASGGVAIGTDQKTA